jgi:hypothetical protein
MRPHNKASRLKRMVPLPLSPLCNLTIDGADGGLKRGNTPMMVKECCDGREDRSWEKVPA